MTWLVLILVAIAALADFLGGYLTIAKKRLSGNTILYFIAIAAGFILAACILDRVPETMKENPQGALFILVGFMAIYLIENLFSTHAHSEVVPDHGHAFVGRERGCEHLISPSAGYAALVGLALHAFFDGVAIAAGFLMSHHTGILMFLAVIFHKVPEGFSISSLMMASGRSRLAGLLSSLVLGAATFLGGVFAILTGSGHLGFARALLTLATGTFLYIGASDLIPATNEGKNRLSVLFVLLGIALFMISVFFLKRAGIHP